MSVQALAGIAIAPDATESLDWFKVELRLGLKALWSMPRERLGPTQRVTFRLDYVHEQFDDGRWNTAKPAIPSPADLDRAIMVDEWLSWVDSGDRTIIKARAAGASWVDLIQRTGLSESTLRRRYLSALTIIRDRHLANRQKIC